MKHTGLLIAGLLAVQIVTAQKSVETSAILKSATVYLQGAALTMQGNATVPSGNNEIVFDDLPSNINPATVQVSANANVTILSAVFRLDYLNSKKENVQVQTLKDSLELLNTQLKKVQGSEITIKGQKALLDANRSVGGTNTGLSMEQLTRMYDFYASKMNDLNAQQIALEGKEKKLSEAIQRLNNQLNELNSRFNQPTGQVVVDVASTVDRNCTFELSFIAYDAGWSPAYDARSKDIRSDITLNYKANVWQRTGMDWNKVNIKLSTGNPTVDATGPELSTWYLDFYRPVYVSNDETRKMKLLSVPQAASAGVQAESDKSYDAASSTAADFTTVNQTQLTAEFDIAIPYTIPSDGKPHLISIHDYTLPAVYHYYAVPKMDHDAFLTADISNWEDLNLLPGPLNIFFDGSYVGQSTLDPTITRDSLSVSLGRDKSIVIKREKVKDYSKEKVIGDSKKQSFAYIINVKNTKQEAVDVTLLDQYPVSQQGKIEVTMDDAGGATVDEATGKLTWTVHLQPNEERKIQFSFTVKYPKDQVLSGL